MPPSRASTPGERDAEGRKSTERDDNEHGLTEGNSGRSCSERSELESGFPFRRLTIVTLT